MFLVKTYLEKSDIHGMGVFAEEFIPKGSRVWEFTLGLDRKYSMQEFYMLPVSVQAYVRVNGFSVNGYIYLTVDNDRFTNHADNPNVIFYADGYAIAARDIAKGEEITDNYRRFDQSFDNSFCAPFLQPFKNDSGPGISK